MMSRYRVEGPINFDEIQELFGRTPGSAFNLEDYYRGGGLIPATGRTAGRVARFRIDVDSAATSVAPQQEQFFMYFTGNSQTVDESDIQINGVTAEVTTMLSDTNTAGTTRLLTASSGDVTVYTNISLIPTNAHVMSFLLEDTGDQSVADVYTAFANRGIVFRFEDADDSSNFFELTWFGTGGSRNNTGVVADGTFRLFVHLLPSSLVIGGTRRDYSNTNIRVTAREDARASIDLSIPANTIADSINETLFFSLGLNTALELRNDMLATLQDNANITSEFAVTAANATQADHGVTDGEPIILLTANDNTDYTITLTINEGVGSDLSNSVFRSHVEGIDVTPSEIRLSYVTGHGIPDTDIILGNLDSQGIANVISESIGTNRNVNFPPEFYTFPTGNSANIQTSRERNFFTPPSISVIEAGSSGLANSDFTEVLVQSGRTTVSSANFSNNLTYSTSDITTDNWSFYDSLDPTSGQLTTYTNWPTTGEIFIRVGSNEILASTLRNDLGLVRNPDDTEQTITDTELQFVVVVPNGDAFRYDAIRIRTVNGSYGIVLDGSTFNDIPGVTATPDFTDGDLVRISMIRTPMGAINANVPRNPRTTENLDTQYSTEDVALNANGWNFRQSITGDRVILTAWPTTGEIFLYIGGLDFSFNELEETLDIESINGTLRVPTDSTLTFHYNFLDLVEATSRYDISGIRTVNTGTGVALAVVLDGTTGVHSVANTDPLFENNQVVGLSFNRPTTVLPPISLDNFYNVDNGDAR